MAQLNALAARTAAERVVAPAGAAQALARWYLNAAARNGRARWADFGGVRNPCNTMKLGVMSSAALGTGDC